MPHPHSRKSCHVENVAQGDGERILGGINNLSDVDEDCDFSASMDTGSDSDKEIEKDSRVSNKEVRLILFCTVISQLISRSLLSFLHIRVNQYPLDLPKS